MLRLVKSSSGDQRGFTMVEIIIIVMLLGFIAAIVINGVIGFLTAANVNSANSEVLSVRTAVLGYYSENEIWPETSDDLAVYLDGELKAFYTFNSSTGRVASATTDADGWGTLIWFNVETQMWEK